jgi:hypothetical protein
MSNKCGECKFFRSAQLMGSCRRYPVPQNKHENDWCGEWTEMQLEIVALPVYDVMTDTPKKRGRPAKDAK